MIKVDYYGWINPAMIRRVAVESGASIKYNDGPWVTEWNVRVHFFGKDWPESVSTHPNQEEAYVHARKIEKAVDDHNNSSRQRVRPLSGHAGYGPIGGKRRPRKLR